MAANAVAAPPGGSVLMDGWMMKKKSGGTLLRSLGTQWVTRYFVLHASGRLVYYRSMTYNGTQPPKPDGIVCEDMSQCTIDIAKPSDVKGNEEAVANSFCITAPGGKKGKSHGTLLVTKGPTDFKKWIGACRGMGATMLHGVDANVKDSKKAQDVSKGLSVSSTKTEGDGKSKSMEEKKPTPAVETAPTAPVVEAPPPPSSIKPQEGSVDDSTASLHVRFVPENNIEEIIDKEEIHAKWKPGEEVIKSVSFSEGEDVVIDDDDEVEEEEVEAALVDEEVEKDEAAAVEDTNEVADAAVAETEVEEPEVGMEPAVEKEEECLEMDAPSKDVHEEEAAIAEDAKDAVVDSDPPNAEESVKEDEAVQVAEEVKPSKEDEAMSRKEAARKRMEEAKARRESKRMAAAAKAGESNEKSTSAAPAVAEPLKEETSSSAAEGGSAGSDEKIKVFAYGDTYNEMTRALDSKKVLFGVMTTSIEVLGDDEAFLNSYSKGEHEKLMPISIEYEGSDAHYTDVNKFKNRLHEIGPLIKGYCGVEKLHPIVYEHADKAREQILTLLGAAPRKEDDDDDADLPGSFMMGKGQWTPSAKISTMETSGKTAYKHALDLYGISNVPNGPDLLKIVRDEFGQPYNWVVFKPSKTELIVEDAGSGGVMEMAKVVSECYDDKVLFGLARLSFSGDFGLRQFFCGLEWKGPNCGGVKAMRAIRECLKPMKEMIGKRSFTLSNDVTSEMTPGTLVDLVKRSSNVGYLDASVSVMSMENAHIEEQKAMKKYWKKLGQKERAKKQKEKEVKDKEIEEEDRDILKARDEKLSSLKQVRATRKEKWATMTAPEVLQDLGEGSMSGWVLLEVNL